MKKVRNIVKQLKGITVSIFALCMLLFAGRSEGQIGTLYGGSIVLSNGTNAITFAVPSGLLESYSLTFPTAQSGAGLFLYDSLGILKWGTPIPDALGSGGLLIGPATQQTTTHNDQYLFDVEYAPGSVGPLPGAVIVSEINNPNPSAAGMHVRAKNTNATSTGVAINGVIVNVTNAGSGTSRGICADATGLLNDYAMIFTGTSGTLCGMGTTTPIENLDVNGNIRISGTNGLKITEGTNAAMGTAVLVAGTKVVSTTKVTANSRIFLTSNVAGGGIGVLYVSARTAGASFTISSTSATETSTVGWVIVEPE